MGNRCTVTEKFRMPTECVEIPPMPLDVRRQLMERQVWINNVMRVLGLSYDDANKYWVKIKTANP
jgi:hypothetical protein